MTTHANQEARRDHRAGVIATVVANAHRGRDGRPFRPGDFFPSLAPKPATTQREMRETFLALARAAQKRRIPDE